jgi:hypothetical protein
MRITTAMPACIAAALQCMAPDTEPPMTVATIPKKYAVVQDSLGRIYAMLASGQGDDEPQAAEAGTDQCPRLR